jgi:hypothetical protein
MIELRSSSLAVQGGFPMAQARISRILVLLALMFTGTLLILHTPPALAQAVSFLPAVTYASGGYEPMAVAVGDVNGDGILDIVVANFCRDGDSCPNGDAYVCYSSEYCSHGAVGVLLGNGDGTFQPPVTYESGEYMAYSVALGDLNGDGKLDLVLVNACGTFPTSYDCPYGTIDIMFGNGDGTFGSPWSIPLGSWYPVSVAMGDVNGDGHLDVAVASVCRERSTCSLNGCTCPAGSVEVLLNGGYGNWIGSQFYDSGGPWGRSVALADVNRDGKLDVLAANSGAIGVLLGNGDGTFQTAVPYGPGGEIGGSSWSVAVGDVNGDGKPDLLAAIQPAGNPSGAAGVLLGNGDGTFKTAVTYGSGGMGSYSVTVSDMNGDGKPDLTLTNLRGLPVTAGPVGVLLSKGDGTFQTAVNFNLGGGLSTSAAVGDLNGDGKPDLVLAPSGGGVGVLLNNTPFCTLVSSLNPSIYGQAVTWAAMVTTSGSIPPTGNVVFQWSNSGRIFTIGTAALNTSGVATLTRSNLNADPFGVPYPIVAVYSGDAANLGSTSGVLSQHILQTKTAASIISSVNPSIQGQAVTFTAKITSPTVRVTGPVTFSVGYTTLGTTQLSGGVAKFTTSALPVGASRVKVTYYGNSNVAKSSPMLVQTVH